MSGYTLGHWIKNFRSNVVVDYKGCWLWHGWTNNQYGRTSLGGVPIGTHRLSWLVHRGHIPDGLWVLHKCDVRPCCNPEHLFLGTSKDNVQDASKKGRLCGGNRAWTRLHPERILHGSRSPNSKLTEAIVLDCRARWHRGEAVLRELAKEHGVAFTTMRRACNGTNWKHVAVLAKHDKEKP